MSKVSDAVMKSLSCGYFLVRYHGPLGDPHIPGAEALKDTLAALHGPPYAVIKRSDLKLQGRNKLFAIPVEKLTFVDTPGNIQFTLSRLNQIRRAGFIVPSNEALASILQNEDQMIERVNNKLPLCCESFAVSSRSGCLFSPKKTAPRDDFIATALKMVEAEAKTSSLDKVKALLKQERRDIPPPPDIGFLLGALNWTLDKRSQ